MRMVILQIQYGLNHHDNNFKRRSIWQVYQLRLVFIVPQTDAQLAAHDTAGDTEESNNTVRATRKAAYGDIGDQLDEIFKDIDAWKTRIQGIKDANPKS